MRNLLTRKKSDYYHNSIQALEGEVSSAALQFMQEEFNWLRDSNDAYTVVQGEKIELKSKLNGKVYLIDSERRSCSCHLSSVLLLCCKHMFWYKKYVLGDVTQFSKNDVDKRWHLESSGNNKNDNNKNEDNDNNNEGNNFNAYEDEHNYNNEEDDDNNDNNSNDENNSLNNDSDDERIKINPRNKIKVLKNLADRLVSAISVFGGHQLQVLVNYQENFLGSLSDNSFFHKGSAYHSKKKENQIKDKIVARQFNPKGNVQKQKGYVKKFGTKRKDAPTIPTITQPTHVAKKPYSVSSLITPIVTATLVMNEMMSDLTSPFNILSFLTALKNKPIKTLNIDEMIETIDSRTIHLEISQMQVHKVIILFFS